MSWPDAFIHCVMSFPELTVKCSCRSGDGGGCWCSDFFCAVKPTTSILPKSPQAQHLSHTRVLLICQPSLIDFGWAGLHSKDQDHLLHRPQWLFVLSESVRFCPNKIRMPKRTQSMKVLSTCSLHWLQVELEMILSTDVQPTLGIPQHMLEFAVFFVYTKAKLLGLQVTRGRFLSLGVSC